MEAASLIDGSKPAAAAVPSMLPVVGLNPVLLKPVPIPGLKVPAVVVPVPVVVVPVPVVAVPVPVVVPAALRQREEKTSTSKCIMASYASVFPSLHTEPNMLVARSDT